MNKTPTPQDLANNLPKTPTPAVIIALVELAKLARNDDRNAIAELRRHGELLALVGGFDAMEEIAGQVHDYEIEFRPTPYRVSPTIISIWENIPEWANA
ncbi:hypothetical protein [Comamonas thiooxydans]|uniref:hypothetical protein n=1 Tax=Comamonas thiooxydans TaxID=363952 RepID=UPI001CC9A4DB|nr:hypothetical protein [Comamonas thiooxydans]UBQ44606.1 hypothetical protein LCH15_25990 [Comamonas thiooxydans]